MSKRAIRRHHYERLKKKRAFPHGTWGHFIGFWVNTPTPCSCVGCGNQRHYFGEITRQEKEAEVIFDEQLTDFYNSRRLTDGYGYYDGLDWWEECELDGENIDETIDKLKTYNIEVKLI